MVTDSYDYDAFGNLLNSSGTTVNNYRYTGEQFDPNAGFYYLRARYYDQGTGRFTSVDPYSGRMHEPVTLHRYLYVGNNPVINVDPSGEMSIGNVMASVGIMGILNSSTLQNNLEIMPTSCPINQCNKWKITILVAGSASTDKIKGIKKGVTALGISAELRSDDKCNMITNGMNYEYQGLGMGVGADIGGGVSGDGKCFDTKCISWKAHEGIGRATSAGGGAGKYYLSTLWIDTPQAYLGFEWAFGKGAGLSAETTLGYWSLGKDISSH